MICRKYLIGAMAFAIAPFFNTAIAQTVQQSPLAIDTPMVHDPVMAFEDGKYYL